MSFTVFGEHVTNIQLRQLEHIAQILLELVPIESPHRSATIGPDVGQVCVANLSLKRLHQ